LRYEPQKSAVVPPVINPVLVELTRGEIMESVHRGALAIADGDGKVVFALGNVEAVVYPRSSLKPIQAIPLIESGAADAFGLSGEHIALACASHSGEPMHTMRVAEWLGRLELSERDLACGPHPVRYEPVWQEMIRRGEKPGRIHNNCSGKHTGFLTLARHWRIATSGYERHDHPVQQAVSAALGEMSGISAPLPWGIDGCAAPNFALPLSAFARAMARLAHPATLPDVRAQATGRILAAMMAYPELVAGTGRTCTILMRGARAPFVVKAGAEGVYAAIIPQRGLAIALKIDDGAGRASETAVAAVLDALGLLGEDRSSREILCAPILNTRNAVVGERRPAAALLESLKQAFG
jgi:L-asparaginase II